MGKKLWSFNSTANLALSTYKQASNPCIRNLGYDVGTTSKIIFSWADAFLGSGSKTQYVYSVPISDPTATPTLEHTRNLVLGYTVMNCVFRSFAGPWYFAGYASKGQILGTWYYTIHVSYCDTGGSWTDVTLPYFCTSECRILDIVLISANYYVIFTDGTSIKACSISPGTIDLVATGTQTAKTLNAVWGGYYSSATNYRFIMVNGSDVFYKFDFNGSAFTETSVASYGWTVPGSFDIDSQQYFVQYQAEVLLSPAKMYYRNKNMGWTSVTGSNRAGIGWLADANYYSGFSDCYIRVKIIYFADSMYEIYEGGGLMKLKASITDINVGYGDLYASMPVYSGGTFTNEGRIYTRTYTTIYPDKSVTRYPYHAAHECEFEYSTVPITNQCLRLYDTSNILSFVANVNRYKQIGGTYRYFFDSPTLEDLNAEVNLSYTNKKAQEILSDVLAKRCHFLHEVSGSLSTTPTTLHTIAFTGATKVIDVIKFVDEREGYHTAIRPDFSIYYDQMPNASGISKKSSDNDAMQLEDYDVENQELSLVQVTGGFSGGRRHITKAIGKPNFGRFYKRMPELLGTTYDAALEYYTAGPLYDYAAQLLTNHNTTYKKVRLLFQRSTIIYNGTTLIFEYVRGDYNIAQFTGYIYSIEIDWVGNNATIDFGSGIYFVNEKKENGVTTDTLQRDIDNVELHVNAKTTLSEVKADTDIADAISKKHEANHDAGLDEGGTHAVTAETIKHHIDADMTKANGYAYTTDHDAVSGGAGSVTQIPLDTLVENTANVSLNSGGMKTTLAGKYKISFTVLACRTGGATWCEAGLGTSATGNPITAASASAVTPGATFETCISRTILVTLTANTTVYLQFQGSDADTRLGHYAGAGVTASMTMERIE